MQTIELNDKLFHGPEKWNDLTRQNLIDIAKAMAYDGDAVMVNYVLVFLLFGIPKSYMRKLRQFQLEQMTVTLDFLLERNELSKWLLSQLNCGLRKYYGPKDRLADLTALEFVQIEAYYERYVVFKDDRYLDAFIAALYRKRKWFSTKRIAFSEEEIDSRAKQIGKLPEAVKRAIYINYTGCRNLIIRLNPDLFLAGTDTKSTGSKHKFIEWEKHMLGISGGALGDFEAVKQQKLWIVLSHMNDLAKSQRVEP